MDAVADTCIFIDLQRSSNGAVEWLDRNGTVRIVASVVTYAELAVGLENRASLDERLLGIPLLAIDVGCAWIAGGLARKLRSDGRMIGANDIWIAAAALQSWSASPNPQ